MCSMRIIRKKRPLKYKAGDLLGLPFEGYTGNGHGKFECPKCFGIFEARIQDCKRHKVTRCPDCRK
jgi:hypothetical protein